MTDMEKEREDFEKWYQSECSYFYEADEDLFRKDAELDAWKTWQARSAKESELVKQLEDEINNLKKGAKYAQACLNVSNSFAEKMEMTEDRAREIFEGFNGGRNLVELKKDGAYLSDDNYSLEELRAIVYFVERK